MRRQLRGLKELSITKRRELVSELSCPKKFWRSLRRLNVRNSKKNMNLLEVLDEDGKLRTDEEVVEVWANKHFSKLLGLNTYGEGCQYQYLRYSSHGGAQSEYEDCLCQPIIMEEVQ